MIRRTLAAIALRASVALAAPKRSEMKRCSNCQRDNDPDRGSKNCWYCGQPL